MFQLICTHILYSQSLLVGNTLCSLLPHILIRAHRIMFAYFVGYLRSIFPWYCQFCIHNLFCFTGPSNDIRSQASGIDCGNIILFFRSTCICQSSAVVRAVAWSLTDLFGFCLSSMNRIRWECEERGYFLLVTAPSNIIAISTNSVSRLHLYHPCVNYTLQLERICSYDALLLHSIHLSSSANFLRLRSTSVGSRL